MTAPPSAWALKRARRISEVLAHLDARRGKPVSPVVAARPVRTKLGSVVRRPAPAATATHVHTDEHSIEAALVRMGRPRPSYMPLDLWLDLLAAEA